MLGSPSKSRIHSSSLAQWPLCFSMEGPSGQAKGERLQKPEERRQVLLLAGAGMLPLTSLHPDQLHGFGGFLLCLRFSLIPFHRLEVCSGGLVPVFHLAPPFPVKFISLSTRLSSNALHAVPSLPTLHILCCSSCSSLLSLMQLHECGHEKPSNTGNIRLS